MIFTDEMLGLVFTTSRSFLALSSSWLSAASDLRIVEIVEYGESTIKIQGIAFQRQDRTKRYVGRSLS